MYEIVSKIVVEKLLLLSLQNSLTFDVDFDSNKLCVTLFLY